MTLNEVYLRGKNILIKAGIESPAFDTMCIFKFCFNFDRQDIILYRNNNADEKRMQRFFKLIGKRASRYPLQYILEYCEFMNAKFKVGEGVLIPRHDTEVLVSEVLKRIENISCPLILDLCAGPGTIAISLAKNRKDSKIIALEISEIALSYLRENVKLNKVENVDFMRFDILSASDEFTIKKFDAIVSNPPYIPTGELNNLQKEVQNEPKIALDGGDDGLKFYRTIAEKWSKFLKKTGFICVEIGQGQTCEVINLFNKVNLKKIDVIKDLNSIDRVIVAKNL